MKEFRLLGFLAFVSMVSPTKADTFVYVSSAREEQILVFRFDSKTGALALLDRSALPGEPAALTTTPDKSKLLASIRSTGKLASFRRDRSTGKLQLVNVVEAGADPAHITTDSSGRFLLTAYYVAAKVSVHGIGADGALTERPLQELPTADKAHAIQLDASDRFAFVPHTGSNTIFQFRWDRESGRLTPNQRPRMDTGPNTGPRHLAWHPRLPIAYIDNEQANSVSVYQVDSEGRLTAGQTVSTLPADYKLGGATSEIKTHPTGRFIYVANRGHNSLAWFTIDETGLKLTVKGQIATEDNPRSFDITADGQWLIAAGENSNHLATYRIDRETGAAERVHRLRVGKQLWWVLLVDTK